MMNKKINLIMLGLVLMIGIVSAQNVLLPLANITMPGNVIAGSEFKANFDFFYPEGGNNTNDSPLIIMLGIHSQNESYPVWKGDFEINGEVEKCVLNIFGACFFPKTISFNCSEESEQIIRNPLDIEYINNVPDGVFYCYNAEGDLKLNEYDNVHLNIKSNQALYPGEYDILAQMYYLTDERAPIVNITNKNMFENYYREFDNILATATIFDGSEIANKKARITINGAEIFDLNYDYIDNEEYYFSKNTPVDIIENNYKLTISAEDIFGNIGNDTTILRIDRTAPVIELEEPFGVTSGILPIMVNVIDEKSGLDNESVEYRLREISGFSPCPEDGAGSFTCYNSGWQTLPNINESLFGININTTEIGLNGEYWLEVRASDILGNLGVLE